MHLLKHIAWSAFLVIPFFLTSPVLGDIHMLKSSSVLWATSEVSVVQSYTRLRLQVEIVSPCDMFAEKLSSFNSTRATPKYMAVWERNCTAAWNQTIDAIVAGHNSELSDGSKKVNEYDEETNMVMQGITMLLYQNSHGVYFKDPFNFSRNSPLRDDQLKNNTNELRGKCKMMKEFLIKPDYTPVIMEILEKAAITKHGDVFQFTEATDKTFSKGVYRLRFREFAQEIADNIDDVFHSKSSINLPLSDKIAHFFDGSLTNVPSRWRIMASEIIRNDKKNNGTFVNLQLLIPSLVPGSQIVKADPFRLYTNSTGGWCEHEYIGTSMALLWNRELCFRPLYSLPIKDYVPEKNLTDCDVEPEDRRSKWKQGKCFSQKPGDILQIKPYFNTFVIYCFGSQIDLGNETLINCPVYPFRVHGLPTKNIKIDGKELDQLVKERQISMNETHISIEKSWEWNYFQDETLVSEPFCDLFIFRLSADGHFWLYLYTCLVTILAAGLLVAQFRSNLSSAYQRFSSVRLPCIRFTNDAENVEILDDQG